MYHYAQIDDNGYIVGISHLSNEMSEPNLIQIDEDFDPTNKRWNGTTWEGYTPPEPPEPEPSIEEKIFVAVSKSQDELRQEGADMMMSELVKRGLMV